MLFNEIVYGPIHSRRLGLSLGLNVMPTDCKLCSFDCIYCECGFNQPAPHPKLPTVDDFRHALDKKLAELKSQDIHPDVLTFSGNGEPTLHPDFVDIMKVTVELRNKYAPAAKISVLSNSTQLFRTDIREALWLADNRILKLDSAIDTTMRLIDQPVNKQLKVNDIVAMLSQFDSDFILQTCMLRGYVNGVFIDNTTPHELEAWYNVVDMLSPAEVMIYVIDRKTPVDTLEKIDSDTMNRIADELRQRSHQVQVSC